MVDALRLSTLRNLLRCRVDKARRSVSGTRHVGRARRIHQRSRETAQIWNCRATHSALALRPILWHFFDDRVAAALRTTVLLEGRRYPVRRPDFKSGWGRQAVLGGFDSHALPPMTYVSLPRPRSRFRPPGLAVCVVRPSWPDTVRAGSPDYARRWPGLRSRPLPPAVKCGRAPVAH
jgi:hypothetical protein